MKCISLMLFLLGLGLSTQAQPVIAKQPRPKTILFMLHLSTNKIEGLRKRHREKEIPGIMAQDEEINTSIIKDIEKHFRFCAVYFFYDTCFEKAVQKRWNEIPFWQSTQGLLRQVPIDSIKQDVYFAEVSYRAPSIELTPEVTDPNKPHDLRSGDEGPMTLHVYGVNLYDESFRNIPEKIGFTPISLRRQGALWKPKKYVFEGAAKFEAALLRYFGPQSAP